MAVLDRVHARVRSPGDAFRAVRVSSDFAAKPVRFLHDRFHFLAGVLRGVGIVAFRHDAAGSADLDHVGAVLDVLAHFVLHGIHAIGDAEFGSQ